MINEEGKWSEGNEQERGGRKVEAYEREKERKQGRIDFHKFRRNR